MRARNDSGVTVEKLSRSSKLRASKLGAAPAKRLSSLTTIMGRASPVAVDSGWPPTVACTGSVASSVPVGVKFEKASAAAPTSSPIVMRPSPSGSVNVPVTRPSRATLPPTTWAPRKPALMPAFRFVADSDPVATNFSARMKNASSRSRPGARFTPKVNLGVFSSAARTNLQTRGERERGRGVHREAEARGLSTEVDRNLRAAAQREVEIEHQLGLAHVRDEVRELVAKGGDQSVYCRRGVGREIGGDRLVEPAAQSRRQVERFGERRVGERQLLRERCRVVEPVGPIHDGEQALQQRVAHEGGNRDVLGQTEIAFDLDAREHRDQIVEAGDVTVGRAVDRRSSRNPGSRHPRLRRASSPSMSSAPSMSARNMSVSAAGLNSSSVIRLSACGPLVGSTRLTWIVLVREMPWLGATVASSWSRTWKTSATFPVMLGLSISAETASVISGRVVLGEEEALPDRHVRTEADADGDAELRIHGELDVAGAVERQARDGRPEVEVLGELDRIGVEGDGELNGPVQPRSGHPQPQRVGVDTEEAGDFLEQILQSRRGFMEAQPTTQAVEKGCELALDGAGPDDSERGIRCIGRLVQPRRERHDEPARIDGSDGSLDFTTGAPVEHRVAYADPCPARPSPDASTTNLRFAPSSKTAETNETRCVRNRDRDRPDPPSPRQASCRAGGASLRTGRFPPPPGTARPPTRVPRARRRPSAGGTPAPPHPRRRSDRV